MLIVHIMKLKMDMNDKNEFRHAANLCIEILLVCNFSFVFLFVDIICFSYNNPFYVLR